MGYFQVRKGRAKDWNTPQTKTGENIISYIVWVVQILKYSKGSLLIKPRKASKTFRSILSLLLMNDLGQIKKLSTRRGLYMYSTKHLRSLPKPRSLLEMRSNQSVSFVEGAIVNTWPTQVGAFLSMGEFTLFIWNRQVEKLFFKWCHNQVKRTIYCCTLLSKNDKWNEQNFWSCPSSNSQVASWLAQFSSSKACTIQYWIIHDV